MNRLRILFSTVAVLALASAMTTARAGIVSVTSSIDVIAPPPSVQIGDLESNTLIRAFQERMTFTLPQDIEVDITQPGLVNDSSDLTVGTLASGTLTDVFFLHFDPDGSSSVTSGGTITFDRDILGVVISDQRLDATDSPLGHPGTLYPTGTNARATAIGETNDRVLLSADRRSLTVAMTASFPGDQVRIITAAIPEPSSLALSGLGAAGLLGLGLSRRRRT